MRLLAGEEGCNLQEEGCLQLAGEQDGGAGVQSCRCKCRRLQEKQEEEGQPARQSAATQECRQEFGPRRSTPPASNWRRGLQLGGGFSQGEASVPFQR